MKYYVELRQSKMLGMRTGVLYPIYDRHYITNDDGDRRVAYPRIMGYILDLPVMHSNN